MSNILSSIPIIGGLFDDSQEQALEQLRANQQLYGNLQTPDFQTYTPEQYQVAGSYDPQQAQASTISEDPTLRSAQLSALNKMAGLANTGLSDVDQAGFAKAREQADQISHSGTQAALQNAQARGVGGSGLEFVMREQAAQDAAQRAQDAGLSQASQSAQMRALYNQAFGSMAGQVRGQDYNANAANAGILNNFNMYNTQSGNQAQLYNLGQQQQVSNANVTQNNQAQQYNNQLKQQTYGDQLQKVNGQAGANTGVAQGYAAENAANTSERNSNTGLLADAFGLGKSKQDNEE